MRLASRFVLGVLTRRPACLFELEAIAGVHHRQLHLPSRHRLKNFWIPQAAAADRKTEDVDVSQLLIRAGYFRQAYAGIFHMLPLGLRVQAKLEALVDKHMQSLSASKVSLSSISSQKLWEQSGRLGQNQEYFRFKDRKDAAWLLAPTHEEEITSLVKSLVHAPSHLPLRLYQVSRKYRDEKRPRGGLLRGREFIMKDLYTFDMTEKQAHATYAEVREAYNNLFAELKIPYIEARADSGNMGGTKSHEFHFPSSLGEDDIITCSTCDYAKNEEFVPPLNIETLVPADIPIAVDDLKQNLTYKAFISKDRKSLVKVYVGTTGSECVASLINSFVVKKCLDGHVEIDTGVDDAESLFKSIRDPQTVYYLFDQLLPIGAAGQQSREDSSWLEQIGVKSLIMKINDTNTQSSHLLRKRTGDACPECTSKGQSGTLAVTKAIEVAHTFHLGTRYSSKLDLQKPGQRKDVENPYVEMGCHGIGVSRLLAAAASAMSDKTGLVWPRVIAPFEVVIMPLLNPKTMEDHEFIKSAANQVYDELSSHTDSPADVTIDDREVTPGWKFRDAELIGIPVSVVIGREWVQNRLINVECKRLNFAESVSLEGVASCVRRILLQL